MSKWIINHTPERLEIKSPLPVAVLKVLWARGYRDPLAINKFFHPDLADLHDPFLFKDMEMAVKRILRAIKSRERILIFGDYDVDGITGTILLFKIVTDLGGKADYYIPHRIKEGYGFSNKGVDYAIDIGSKLIITVDCGISAVDAINYARLRDVDIIICDHHGVETPPEAFAVLNPKVDSNYPYSELAGCGVAFKLASALSISQNRPLSEVYRYLDLVALGTISDVAPLFDENRIIAKFGLEKLSETENLGLKQLIDVARIAGRKLNCYHVGFVIGPRINAAGRIAEAEKVIKLLLTKNKDEARTIALELDRINRNRQEIEREILDQAITKVEKGVLGERVIVLADDRWHEGVIGIVASRLTERYYRPVFLISLSKDKAKGSARGIAGFDIFGALSTATDVLSDFGGHREAGGFSLDPDKIEEFRIILSEYTKTFPEDMYQPKLFIDCEINLGTIDQNFLDCLEYFEPTGMGNPKPMFLARNLLIVGYPRIVGDNHLKFAVMRDNCSHQAIAFAQGSLISELEVGRSRVDIVFSIDKDRVAVRPRPILKVKELQIKDVEI